jgi:2-polyprenyl-6-methoxyphenol hydroxylase-like FAD-dependent oxidoreductase
LTKREAAIVKSERSDIGAQTSVVDVLVAGAGAAGLAAAIFAKLKGLDVLVIEKSDKVGGTAATSAGTLWIPQNSQGRAVGDKDSILDAAAYLDSLIKTDSKPIQTASFSPAALTRTITPDPVLRFAVALSFQRRLTAAF